MLVDDPGGLRAFGHRDHRARAKVEGRPAVDAKLSAPLEDEHRFVCDELQVDLLSGAPPVWWGADPRAVLPPGPPPGFQGPALTALSSPQDGAEPAGLLVVLPILALPVGVGEGAGVRAHGSPAGKSKKKVEPSPSAE